MTTPQDKAGDGSRQGARPAVIVSVLAVAALVVIAAVVVFKPKGPAPGPEPHAPTIAETSVGHSGPPAATTGTNAGETAHALPVPAGAGTNPAGAVPVIAGSSVQDLIKLLKNAALPMKDRKAAIEALAKLGTPEAIAALKEVLAGGSEEMRAAVAEGLGACSSPECAALLLGLLNDASQPVIEAAIRGLAQLGSPQATAALAQLLNDPLRSAELRSSAAIGLGSITDPAAMQALSQAAMTIGDEDIVTQVLEAIGGRNFTETQSFYQQYMGSAVSSDLRVAAIESLAQAQGDPTSFLAGYLTDADADVRASAAWTMSATDATGNSGAQLLASLQGEQDPEVRRRLYQALQNQESYDPGTAMALVQRETDVAAQIAGLDMLAASLRSNPSPEVQNYFDQTAAPLLKTTALSADGNHERMAALIALVRASTPAAMTALQDLAQHATDPRIQQSAARAVANPMPAIPKTTR